MKKLILAVSALPFVALSAFAEGADLSTLTAGLTTNATMVTGALWAAAGAFITVFVAYIAIKAVMKGAKAVS